MKEKVGKIPEVEQLKENQAGSAGFEKKRIIDLLDIQLLLAVIVFFVSAWAYLNSVICDFTTTEPYNERMAYVLVHYILSAVLILCVGITNIKGRYLLKTDQNDLSKRERRYIDLFINGWLWVFLLCALILTFSDFLWWIGGVLFIIWLFWYMIKKDFGINEAVVINLLLILCFPVFISLMTNITHNVEIEVTHDPETDFLTMTIDPKSYDSKYIVDGLANNDLIKNEQYTVKGYVIYTKNAYIHNNEVVVSLVSPASGQNFWKYAVAKILNYDLPTHISTNSPHYNKTKIINIR